MRHNRHSLALAAVLSATACTGPDIADCSDIVGVDAYIDQAPNDEVGATARDIQAKIAAVLEAIADQGVEIEGKNVKVLIGQIRAGIVIVMVNGQPVVANLDIDGGLEIFSTSDPDTTDSEDQPPVGGAEPIPQEPPAGSEDDGSKSPNKIPDALRRILEQLPGDDGRDV